MATETLSPAESTIATQTTHSDLEGKQYKINNVVAVLHTNDFGGIRVDYYRDPGNEPQRDGKKSPLLLPHIKSELSNAVHIQDPRAIVGQSSNRRAPEEPADKSEIEAQHPQHKFTGCTYIESGKEAAKEEILKTIDQQFLYYQEKPYYELGFDKTIFPHAAQFDL